ncbi:putative fatty acyl-CoA reductase CG5065 [Solenopsis invicta]|uniref:putative fatty acyl-CoA reductase CG5065 n=1 Tax=Solenopsis invicta TaxID=13686 RepID=UPI00193CC2E2|nr:putative fatty acyl-CoA reductase CG5065 [Solenopsis invicta]
MWRVENIIALIEFASAHASCRNINVNIQDMDWDRYLRQYLLKIRTYILKDNFDTLPYAWNRLNKLYWIHQCIKIFSIAALLGIIKYA